MSNQNEMKAAAQWCLRDIRKGILSTADASKILYEASGGDRNLQTFGQNLLDKALSFGARSVG